MSQLRSYLSRFPQVKKLATRLLGVIPLKCRLGRPFWEWYAFYQESESWEAPRLLEFQLGRLRRLLGELVVTSRFYRSRVCPERIARLSSLDDFRQLVPIISRTEFKEFQSDILCDSWRSRKLSKSTTSGTTGSALEFYHPVEDDDREWAAICHQWRRTGYDPGKSRRVEFRGLTATGRLIDVYPHYNFMRCSILHLKKEHVVHYADEIRRHGMDFYHGYPSALYLLAQEIVRNGIRFPQPKAILLASEMVYDWQLDQIQEAFPKAKIFAHYGCAERTVLAGWCEFRREYHVLPQYGLFERDEMTSEIIGTNLFNDVNPFIRYRMSDTVNALDPAPCPDCGRSYTPRLVELGGRAEDYLYSREKGWIPAAILTYPFKSLKAIKKVQIFQDKLDTVIVSYTHSGQREDLLASDLRHLQVGLQGILGNGTRLIFQFIEEFERGKTGKFKWIICKLENMPSRK